MADVGEDPSGPSVARGPADPPAGQDPAPSRRPPGARPAGPYPDGAFPPADGDPLWSRTAWWPTPPGARRLRTRVLYGVARAGVAVTAVVTALLVAFAVRDGPERVERTAQGTWPALATATPSPSPGARRVRLPRLPSPTPMPVPSGTGSPVVDLVADTEAGIGYARFGGPWVTADARAFTRAQRVGPARLPRTLIGSRPLPGAVPEEPLTSAAQYRRLAVAAARWTLRYHPPATRVVWTGSQRFGSGLGWVLSYRVSYTVRGERGSSQAVVAVVAVPGRTRPALLFATVPHTREELYPDLNALVASLRPL